MKQCVNNQCKASINDSAEFCPSCGKRQPGKSGPMAAPAPSAGMPSASAGLAPSPSTGMSVSNSGRAQEKADTSGPFATQAHDAAPAPTQEKTSNWKWYSGVVVVVLLIRAFLSNSDDKAAAPPPAAPSAKSAPTNGLVSVKKAKINIGALQCRYTGTMLNGVPHGDGTAKCGTIWSYTGKFANGACSGQGIMTYYVTKASEGTSVGVGPPMTEEHTFVASFTDCSNGDGVYTWANGSTTKSRLVNGEWNNY